MKLGIYMNAYPASIEERVEKMAKYGFTATFSMADSPTLDEEVRACREAGIVHENLHAPFQKINAMWQEGEEGEEMLRSLMDAVDNARKYDIPVLVIHLSSGKNPPRVCEIGFSRFDRLFAYAKEQGVCLAIENQRTLGILSLCMDYYPDAMFCYDVGHQYSFGKGIPFMEAFGNKLVAVHIHDNNTEEDEHRLPFDADIDFGPVAMDIADSPYQGAVMLEVVATHTSYYDGVSADEYYSRAMASAQRLRELISYHRTGY